MQTVKQLITSKISHLLKCHVMSSLAIFKLFHILDLHAVNDEHQTESFAFIQLLNEPMFSYSLQVKKHAFGDKKQKQVSLKAVGFMADLFTSLERCGFNDHEASAFLIRTLFCLYTDDAGVWDRHLFQEFL